MKKRTLENALPITQMTLTKSIIQVLAEKIIQKRLQEAKAKANKAA